MVEQSQLTESHFFKNPTFQLLNLLISHNRRAIYTIQNGYQQLLNCEIISKTCIDISNKSTECHVQSHPDFLKMKIRKLDL